MPKLSTLARPTGLFLTASTGALAGWWWQSRADQTAVEERTRVRLRAWDRR